jgi:hypothetical protein
MFLEEFKARRLAKPTQIKVVVALSLFFGIYVASKAQEGTKNKVLTYQESEFRKARIMGDPYGAFNQGKERLLDRTAKEYSQNQKGLNEVLMRLEGKISELEGKISSSEAGKQTLPTGDPIIPRATLDSQGLGTNATTVAPAGDFGEVRAMQPPLDGQKDSLPRALHPSVGSAFRERQPLVSRGPAVLSFPVESTGPRERTEIVLPVGSFVKAKLLTGVQSPEGKAYPALLELDFAHILPNKKTVDLKGCFMIAKSEGDLSTERVQMQATKLSCVARDGNFFERDVNAFVADAVDNSFGVSGTVNTKQDRVAAMAFLSAVVEGVGSAVQMAQTSEQTSADGSSRRTLTGDKGKYIAAGGAAQAAGMVASWYLKQAENLLPTINVGSGQDVWVIMNASVDLPNAYFQHALAGESHGKDAALVNHLLD